MPVVNIVDVSVYKLGDERLWGHHIDVPVPKSQTEVYAISVGGWVLGRNSSAVTVELVNEGAVYRRIPIDVHRPDIAAAYPAIPEAENSGFRATVNVLGLTPEFELFARVVLQNGSRIPIGGIRARRRSLRSGFQPRLQPLMLTTLGRTGSSWLMLILAQHPQVVAYRPFYYEPRVATYWMEILNALSEPASYLQSVLAEIYGDYWWIGEKRLSGQTPTLVDPQIQQWLGRDSIESLAAFCQNRIEGFYERAAVDQARTEPVYFAEKGWPDHFPRMIWELYPQAREIFLVRDFRDMVCSIFAYNRKRGTAAFGREFTNSDQEFIHLLQGHAAAMLQAWKKRSEKAYLLRYEDLIGQPERTVESMLDYLALDSDPATIQRTLQQATETMPEAQREHQTSSDPVTSIGRWQHELNPSLQSLCREAFTDILREFDYTE